MGRQCRGVSAAIFDAGASAVRWGDSTVVRQRGLGGFPMSDCRKALPRQLLQRLEPPFGFAVPSSRQSRPTDCSPQRTGST
ncbi:hypothetical protein LC593_36035 [Nostoc sp. CHAB 5844]|nr:hypothetical protein [Nostoc sp. CHAB 5844]